MQNIKKQWGNKLRNLVQRHTWSCPDETSAWPTLCYGSEAWTIWKQDTNRTI